jgi:NAD(P)-dependent dehydrogenase (short-subunit alcohol dehydrogenase family)
MIDTPMQDQVLDEIAKSQGVEREALSAGRTAMIPLGRAGTADESAPVVRFLLSSEAAYMTGQSVNITGGQLMW